jgi:hypothetical protein
MDSLDVFWLVEAVEAVNPYLDAVIIEDVPTRLSSDLSLQRIPADWAVGSLFGIMDAVRYWRGVTVVMNDLPQCWEKERCILRG